MTWRSPAARAAHPPTCYLPPPFYALRRVAPGPFGLSVGRAMRSHGLKRRQGTSRRRRDSTTMRRSVAAAAWWGAGRAWFLCWFVAAAAAARLVGSARPAAYCFSARWGLEPVQLRGGPIRPAPMLSHFGPAECIARLARPPARRGVVGEGCTGRSGPEPPTGASERSSLAGLRHDL